MALVEQNYTLDFVAGDRRDRAILRHIVLSLFAGMLLGGLGALLTSGSALPSVLYEPHAYVLLVVVLGRTAAGLGWAVLSSVLATFGTVLSMLLASTFTAGAWPTSLGTGGAAMNFTIVKLVTIGVLSYLTKRHDRWGDLAAGGAAGVALLGGVDRMLPGSAGHVPGFWPWGALVAVLLAAGMIVSLGRGRGRDRVCAGAIALTVAASYFVFLAGL